MNDDGTFEKLAGGRARISEQLSKVVVGQSEVVEQVLTALIAGGNCLITGAPGLAKTLLVKTLADIFSLRFQRIQFTPDLMPSDITGMEILSESEGVRSMKFVEGPVFAQMLLADEINRTPPKTQAALLEAMQERQVTVAGKRYELPRPFFVLATQNPLEMEGTYVLPEAQLDRFMLCHRLSYPAAGEEEEVLRRTLKLGLREDGRGAVPRTSFDLLSRGPVASLEDLVRSMGEVQKVHVSEVFVRHAVELVRRTRETREIEVGASPRAGIALVQAARARAYVHGRDYAVPEDLFALAEDVLLHRIRLRYEALAEGLTGATVLRRLVSDVA